MQALETEEWNTDNWETPPEVARQMAKLIKPSDRRILEPCAGTGKIAKELVTHGHVFVECVEIDFHRCMKGFNQLAFQDNCSWICTDFLDGTFRSHYDAVVANLPFSEAMKFIKKSLPLLNKRNPESRLLLLLPHDYFSTMERGDEFREMDAHIHHTYAYQGRVAFLKDEVPYKRRQKYDAVFDIRPGKDNATTTFLNDL